MTMPAFLRLLNRPLHGAWRRCRCGPGLGRRAPVEPDETAETATLPADERPPGCGWFDSSHELQQGLQVTEHASGEALGAELPLGDWLAMHLAGWGRAEVSAGA